MSTETAEVKHPEIALTPVQSSKVAAIGHDPVSNTLAVQFSARGDKPGSVYHYANFTAEDFEKFRTAESLGKHFGAHIQHAKAHPYTKVS